MKYLRQSTAATVIVGPFVSVTTALSITTLTDQSANGRLVKNGTGGTITASSWAHDAQGHYLVGMSTTHTDTVGRLRIAFFDSATYLPVWEDFTVLAAAVYDVIFGTVAPSTHTAAAAAALVLATPANLLATDSSGRVTLAAVTHTGATIPNVTTLTTYTGNTPQTGDAFLRIGAAGAGLTALGDTRLANLNATIASRSSHTAADVWAATTRTLSAFGFSVTASSVTDKTGYSLTQTFPANFASLAITAGGAMTAGTVSDKAGYSLTTAPPTAAEIDTQLSGTHGAGAWDAAGGITITDVQTALTNQGYTSARADNLDNLDAAVSSRSTYAGGPVASVSAPVTVDYSQAGPTFRDLTNVASPTLGDLLAGSYAAAIGAETVSGTAYTLVGPGSVTVRSFVLDDPDAPTSRT